MARHEPHIQSIKRGKYLIWEKISHFPDFSNVRERERERGGGGGGGEKPRVPLAICQGFIGRNPLS